MSHELKDSDPARIESGADLSAAKYRKLFESAPIGLGLVTEDGRLIEFNDAILKPGGYSRADVEKFRGVEELYSDPQERAKVVEILQRDGVLHQYELKFKRKDGGTYDAALSVSAFDIGGQRHHLAMVEDITGRKKAERALLASEMRFRALIENSAEVIVLFSADGTINYISPSVKRVLGYEPEEVIGLPGDRLIHPDDLEVANTHFSMGIDKPGVVHRFSDIRLEHKDGSYRCIEITGQNLLHDPNVEALVSNFRDVTEQRRTEDELRRSESELRALFEQASFGIYRSDLEGSFHIVNRALVKMLGYASTDELLGIDIAADLYVNPAQCQWLVELSRNAEVLPPHEVRWKRKDGQTIIVRLNGRGLYNQKRDLIGFEMMAEDVTRQRALEDQLRHSQKMQAVGQLSGGIAHDFNNLLTTIMGNAQLMQQSLSPHEKELLGHIEQILLAAQRGADMNKKLLAFSRKERLRFDSVDLSQLCQETTHLLRRILPEDIQVRIVSRLHGELIKADRGAVQQILINLCTNARDAMPNGGILTIETRAVQADPEGRPWRDWTKEQYVVLRVSDTGQGMSAETRQRVFEPFYTTKDRGRGTGLGMSMVYGLAKQHNGFVDVTSDMGKGTTVTIYFPQLPDWLVEEKQVPQATSAHIQTGTEKILVVEDDPHIRGLALRILGEAGYQVSVAPDGEHALKLLAHESVETDLVITDIVMPSLGGYQLYREARKLGKESKFLLTSGYPSQEKDLSLPLLKKPWGPIELTRAVRSALDESESPS